MIQTDTIEIRDLRQQDWLWTSKALLFSENIDGNTYKVYSGLAAYSDNKTQEAFPSIPTLARKLHMGRNTVIRALQKLEEAGFISVERQLGQHNIYSLLKIVGDAPLKAPKAKVEKEASENWVKEILEWAESRKQTKFVNYGKQIGALGAMKKSGYTPEDIKGCFVLMEKDEWWQPRGFDFSNIANELPKKLFSIRQRHGTPIFEQLVKR